MCLDLNEADRIIELAQRKDRIVAVDMHKRYDPDHLRIREDLRHRIGEPLYGVACLEEPLQVSASTFKWADQSDPFSYVGPHWVDLICHYYHSKPVSLTAVGQKKRLVRDSIDAYDAVQVRVDFDNGMSIHFLNNWITPPDFEGPVNQGHEIVGTSARSRATSNTAGLRWWHQGGGSRTANTHFTRDVKRPDGARAYVGYGVDSLTAGLAAICRVKFLGASRQSLAEPYPTAEEARITVAILHAAAPGAGPQFQIPPGRPGAAVSARFGPDGITIVDPNRAGEGNVFERVYQVKPI